MMGGCRDLKSGWSEAPASVGFVLSDTSFRDVGGEAGVTVLLLFMLPGLISVYHSGLTGPTGVTH